MIISFHEGSTVQRLFIDEITAINKWELVLKKMADTYYEFQRYRSHPRFRQVLTHNFNNKKDMDLSALVL